MSDNEIHINVKGPSELKIQISITTDKTVLDLKRDIAEKSDVEADRQRLIYAGRVLKDEDQLSVYKIQSSHTIHMVKGASRSAPASGSTSAPPSQQIPAMQAGQNPSDPLTLLNSHMGFGAMAGLNPFADMGLNQNDPNMFQNMMQSPEFLQQMSSLMSNPAILDSIIALNPQLASMGPQIREIFQSSQFREMMSNPETMRTMMQMSTMMRGAGLGGGGGGGAFPGAFPAPGVPSSAAGTGATSTSPISPSAISPPGTGTAGTGANAGASATGLPNPALLQALMGAGSFGGGLGGFGGMGNMGNMGGMGGGASPFGAPAAPADTRPPEERFQVQLQQLQDMGFANAAQNVRALLATGGNVHSAIEYILNGGGL